MHHFHLYEAELAASSTVPMILKGYGGAGPAPDVPEEPTSQGVRHYVQTSGARRRQAKVSDSAGTSAL